MIQAQACVRKTLYVCLLYYVYVYVTMSSGSLNFSFKVEYNRLVLPKFIKFIFNSVNCIRQHHTFYNTTARS